jgi:hypothetical protein
MLSKQDKENATTAGRWDTSLENADHQDATNKKEEGDKGTEETSVDREEEEATGGTSKDQETTASPLTH